jgi:conserved hypothetical protein
MNYKVINTGSDGNAIVLEDIILIDCGVSFKKLNECYKQLKIVLLTHIHQDHFNKKTISKLAIERPTLRFVCCKWLVEDLVKCGVNKKNIDVVEIGKKYNYGILKIIPIKLYHDVPNCGYRIFINDKKIIYMTDTKTLEGITAKNYDLYLVEGNYESKEELHSRAVNEIYESRVINTHLSKEYTSEWLMNNMGNNSKYMFMHEHKERNKNEVRTGKDR